MASELLKRWVRTQPRQVIEQFFRCGMKFGRDWMPVEVDAATLKRLEAEQMLEVVDSDPAGNTDTSESGTGAGGGDLVAPPEDEAARAAAIKAAILIIDVANETLWTKGGAPTTAAIDAACGWVAGSTKAAERDTVWAELKESK